MSLKMFIFEQDITMMKHYFTVILKAGATSYCYQL